MPLRWAPFPNSHGLYFHSAPIYTATLGQFTHVRCYISNTHHSINATDLVAAF